MRTIWKYLVPIGLKELDKTGPAPAPKGAILRHVGMDPATGDPAAWYEVESSQAESEPRRLVALGTGHEIPPEAEYRGTVQSAPFMWHVFELPRG